MPIPRIHFNPPFDLHLLRGQSVDMSDFIVVGDTLISEYESNHENVKFQYKILSHGHYENNIYRVLDFSFDQNSRILRIDRAWPKNDIYNFIFIVKAEDRNDKSSTEAELRIHIHNSITSAWLTPSPLTAYVGIPGFRASIYAQYDDGIVSEVGTMLNEKGTALENLNITEDLAITWECNERPGFVDKNTGEIKPTVEGNFNIRAILKNRTLGVDITAHGTVRVTRELSANSKIRAELVTQGKCPGFPYINTVPNFLILADGFIDKGKDKEKGDRKAFNDMVDNFVKYLMTSQVASPFKYLAGTINFWKVFLPSRERGATGRKELYLCGDGDDRSAKEIRTKKPANMDSAKWSLANIMYYVGLPVPKHSASKNRYNQNKPMKINQIRDEWIAFSGLKRAQVVNIPKEKIEKWRACALRVLPEEQDTALGIFSNSYDALNSGNNYNDIKFNPKRMTRARLNIFLKSLRESGNGIIGKNFLSSIAPTGKKNSDGHDINIMPKDFDNVIILSASNRGRAVNGWGYFFTEINNCKDGIKVEVKGSKTNVQVTNDKHELSVEQKAVLTHELGHSCGLEDEYGEPPPQKSYAGKFIDHRSVSNWGYAVYDRAPFKKGPEKLDWSGNVQARQDLLIGDDTAQDGFIIDSDKIKWRYHRIEKCGVLAAAPSPAPGYKRYSMTLMPEEATQFKTGELVILRKRRTRVLRINGKWYRKEPIHGYINARPNPIAADATYELTPAVSPVLKVLKVNSQINQILVSVENLNPPFHACFNTLNEWEEIIVYKPMAPPPSWHTLPYEFAEVISKKVLDYLRASPYPFNVRADRAARNVLKEIIDRDSVQQSRIPGKLIPCCSSCKKRIVALYSGGDQRHGHVYHPTAQCLMRSHYDSNEGCMEELCEVCKYTIVNVIDPIMHRLLNKKYSNKIYPI